MTRPAPIPSLSLVAALLAAACSREPEPSALDRLDNALIDADPGRNDPALRAAIAGQIMVDPALAQQENAATRPPDRLAAGEVPVDVARPDPVDPATLQRAPVPSRTPDARAAAAHGALTLGALAARQPGAAGTRCAQRIGYSATWANRLPPALPLYPDARVQEAAGTLADGCDLRIVSFVSGAPAAKIADWYYTHARRAGYSAEHRLDGARHVLGGTRGAAAYVVYATPRPGGGSAVDLVANAGS